jgi:hypothetical protein
MKTNEISRFKLIYTVGFTMKKKLSFREIKIIIQSKSQNLTWKVIANIVGSKPETVRGAYRREM